VPLSPRAQDYIDAILKTCSESECAPVSVILFGSAAAGGFSDTVSDVDLILVLPDTAKPECKPHFKAAVKQLEIKHGIGIAPSQRLGGLESLVNRITGNDHSVFVCTRGDLLSGDPGRMLGLKPAQAFFVDRVVIPSIVFSAVTVRGEEFLPQIHLPPIRRVDVFIAFFGLFNQVLLTAGLFPILDGATGFAMGALKRSVHNCYFCYHGRRAVLEEEITFYGANAAFRLSNSCCRCEALTKSRSALCSAASLHLSGCTCAQLSRTAFRVRLSTATN